MGKPGLIWFIFILFTWQNSTNTIHDKSIDGVLGTRSRGGRMVGADKSTELWWHPKSLTLWSKFLYNMANWFICHAMRCVGLWTWVTAAEKRIFLNGWLSFTRDAISTWSEATKRGQTSNQFDDVWPKDSNSSTYNYEDRGKVKVTLCRPYSSISGQISCLCWEGTHLGTGLPEVSSSG